MLSKMMLLELQEYVEKHLNILKSAVCDPMCYAEEVSSNYSHHSELEDYIINKRKAKFNQVLFGLIDKKGASDSDIYKKAGIDRRHFSKIRSNPDYRLGKNTAIALALALELTEKETTKLLSAAGYSLSDSDTFDLVIQFCLEKKIFDIQSVNQALDYFSLKPLGGVLE